MKRMLFFIVVALAITSYSSITDVTTSQDEGYLYDDYSVVNSEVCDTAAVYDGMVVACEDSTFYDTTYDFAIPGMDVLSTPSYVGQRFEYTTSEGSVFFFVVNSDGSTVTLEKGFANNVEILTIPNIVKGLDTYFSVTAINDFAFNTPTVQGQECGKDSPMDGVRILVLSEGIEYVGLNCFGNAIDLEAVVIPPSLKNLSYFMFGDCVKLKSVYIPIESNLQEIGDFAFANCTSLKSFYIPAFVTSIKQGPWRNCKSLSELRIADDNFDFDVFDGVLYSGDKQHLIQYPAGKNDKEYNVRFGTKSIDNSAFYGNDFISKVSFPAALDSISHIAFYGCQNLRDVVFSDKIEVIGNSAFEDCSKLKEIQLYGKPKFTYYGEGDSYNTFMPYTEVTITEDAPAPKIMEGDGGILERVWLTISQLQNFETMEILNNEDYGFPDYLGKAKATMYANAAPKEDVLKILEVIPNNMLLFENVNRKGKITRFYIDNSKKETQTLYFFGGIGGNDLCVAIFKGGNNQKIQEMVRELNNLKNNASSQF